MYGLKACESLGRRSGHSFGADPSRECSPLQVLNCPGPEWWTGLSNGQIRALVEALEGNGRGARVKMGVSGLLWYCNPLLLSEAL